MMKCVGYCIISFLFFLWLENLKIKKQREAWLLVKIFIGAYAKAALYSGLSAAWMLQSSLQGSVYGVS
jgi:hypothetical protein